MDKDSLVSIRKRAEAAVKDMLDGDLKTKAFEVILSQLLTGVEAANPPVGHRNRSKKESKETNEQAKEKPTTAGRINALVEDSFFSKQRTLAEVVAELATRGWHYKQTDLSGPMLNLTREKKLRRVPVKDGNKKIFKYSNW